jgi:predicted transposase YdaD
MRWDMAILTESPWYQQILREGKEQGRREEILSGIELALEIKFGADSLQLMSQISQISNLEQLKTIQRSIKTINNLDELRQLIEQMKIS